MCINEELRLPLFALGAPHQTDTFLASPCKLIHSMDLPRYFEWLELESTCRVMRGAAAWVEHESGLPEAGA
jgi:hypothetical protein